MLQVRCGELAPARTPGSSQPCAPSKPPRQLPPLSPRPRALARAASSPDPGWGSNPTDPVYALSGGVLSAAPWAASTRGNDLRGPGATAGGHEGLGIRAAVRGTSTAPAPTVAPASDPPLRRVASEGFTFSFPTLYPKLARSARARLAFERGANPALEPAPMTGLLWPSAASATLPCQTLCDADCAARLDALLAPSGALASGEGGGAQAACSAEGSPGAAAAPWQISAGESLARFSAAIAQAAGGSCAGACAALGERPVERSDCAMDPIKHASGGHGSTNEHHSFAGRNAPAGVGSAVEGACAIGSQGDADQHGHPAQAHKSQACPANVDAWPGAGRGAKGAGDSDGKGGADRHEGAVQADGLSGRGGNRAEIYVSMAGCTVRLSPDPTPGSSCAAADSVGCEASVGARKVPGRSRESAEAVLAEGETQNPDPKPSTSAESVGDSCAALADTAATTPRVAAGAPLALSCKSPNPSPGPAPPARMRGKGASWRLRRVSPGAPFGSSISMPGSATASATASAAASAERATAAQSASTASSSEHAHPEPAFCASPCCHQTASGTGRTDTPGSTGGPARLGSARDEEARQVPPAAAAGWQAQALGHLPEAADYSGCSGDSGRSGSGSDPDGALADCFHEPADGGGGGGRAVGGGGGVDGGGAGSDASDGDSVALGWEAESACSRISCDGWGAYKVPGLNPKHMTAALLLRPRAHSVAEEAVPGQDPKPALALPRRAHSLGWEARFERCCGPALLEAPPAAARGAAH